jgi:hypothetical protein
MLIVTNGYRDGFAGDRLIYVGRQNKKLNLRSSLLSNPFVIGRDGYDRDSVLSEYRIWLYKQIRDKTKAYEYLLTLIPRHKSKTVYIRISLLLYP